jgi:dolichol-phosphate mannosyltransferase
MVAAADPVTTPQQAARERVTVVIAARNEAENLVAVLPRVCEICTDILVIDGASTDATAAVARRHGARVISDAGRGKGLALRAAIPHITRDITVFMDADGSHDARMIPALISPIMHGKADHVTGSRLLGGSSELHGGFDEFIRLAGSSFAMACINRLFHTCLSDSQNGFRAVRTDVLRQLNLTDRGTTIEQEMIIKTLRGGWRLAEVPAHEFRRLHGTSCIRVGRAWMWYLWSLFKHLFLSRAVQRCDSPLSKGDQGGCSA